MTTTSPRSPSNSLYALAVLDASKAYAERSRELRAMRSSLALLDAEMPGLRARHIAPHVSQIRWLPVSRALGIHMACPDDASLLHATLLELGFEEATSDTFVTVRLVDLRKGALKVNVVAYRSKASA